MNLQFKPLYCNQSMGTYGSWGVKIEIAPPAYFPDAPENEAIQRAANEASSILERALMIEAIKQDERAQKRRTLEREQIISLFPNLIFVEEIPNGYCSSWCCAHLPWFVVTTIVGRITIGWRKRVINIDWEAIEKAKMAQELFPKEEVTKGDKYIHAWGVEKAREYIAAIIDSAK